MRTGGLKTEVFNIETRTWDDNNKPDYQFCGERLQYMEFATTSHGDFVLFFGGKCHTWGNSQTIDTVAKYSSDNTWSQVGTLQQPRMRNALAMNNNHVYLIGGTIGEDVTALPIEIWSINEDDGSVSYVQTMPEPILDNWWDNPMAFFVNPDICEQFCIRATNTNGARVSSKIAKNKPNRFCHHRIAF